MLLCCALRPLGRYQGSFVVPTPAGATPGSSVAYVFNISANEGAKLFIDGALVGATPINAANTAASRVSVQVVLPAGTTHSLDLHYFNGWNTLWLNVTLSINGGPHQGLAPSMVRNHSRPTAPFARYHF